MESLIKLLQFIDQRSSLSVVLVLAFILFCLLFTRRIVINKKDGYYSLNDKQQKVKQLEKDVKGEE